MAEQEPKLPSLQPEVRVLSTALPFLEVCSFASCLMTARSVLGTDAKTIRHAGGLPGELWVRESGGAGVIGGTFRFPGRCESAQEVAGSGVGAASGLGRLGEVLARQLEVCSVLLGAARGISWPDVLAVVTRMCSCQRLLVSLAPHSRFS